MKKYFMKNSNEEIKFGDMIEVDFTKDTPDGGTHFYHIESKFLPELLPIFLENEVIKEVELDDEDFEGSNPEVEETYIKDNILLLLDNILDITKGLTNTNEEVCKTQEDLELRMDELEGAITKQAKVISGLTKIVAALNDKVKQNAKKTA